MNKKYPLLTATVLLSLATYAQTKKPVTTVKKAVPTKTVVKPAAKPPLSLKSQLDSVSYAFGASIAHDLKERGVNSLNYALLNKAMADVFSNGTINLTEEQSNRTIGNYFSQLNKKQFAGNIAKSESFLEENKKQPGVVSLPSGLQYVVLNAGTGEKPKATDEVTVHYKGTLLDGKQFDSSYDRGEPIALTLNQVIPGWTEGIQLMPVGSKYKFFIPYSLGYGERGAGQDIPPYSTLIFEVELIKIGKLEEAK